MNKESWFDLWPGEDTLIFRFSKASTLAVGPTTRHPIQWVPLASSLAAKWVRLEAKHLDVSNADVKNVWSHIFTSAVCLRNVHRNSLAVHFQDSGRITVTSEVYHDGRLKSRSKGYLHNIIVGNCSNGERETTLCEMSSWRQNSGSPSWV